MNILVLNGSPKGDYSITLQSVLYLQKKYKTHNFDILHIGQRIKSIEKEFSEILSKINHADLLIFSYPVYTFIAPSQLHRFIELLKEQDIDLTNKFVTQISTSKHFYDVTAHRYIQDNCHDLNMKYIKGLSADMDDLLSDKGQNDLIKYFDYVLWSIENNVYESIPKKYSYHPVLCDVVKSLPKNDGNIIIITDCNDDEIYLLNMIDRFQSKLPIDSRIINLNDIRIDGGCLGCFNCAVDGKCIYKDRFDDYLRNEIQTAQAIIYAFTIKDHSMGSLFKKFDDRNFCNGHRTVTMGMPIGYLISGNYSNEFNLQMIVEARSEVGSNYLAGVATDEINPNEEIDVLVQKLVYALDNKYVLPSNFYGVGGMKIFRDLIYTMQGMMKADHKFYKEHGIYDFPQKKKGTMILMYLVGFLLSNEKIKSKMGNKMNEGMIASHRKILDNIK